MTTSIRSDGPKRRILVADDHPVIRMGLRQILAGTDDMTVSAEAADGDELLERIRNEELDAVVMDLTMPGRNGLEVLQQLKTLQPDLPVLILSMHPEDHYASRVIRLGASGYLQKESAATTLIEALRRVLAGQIYISSAFAQELADELRNPRTKHRYETLSTREFEVMLMLASGSSPTQIADELCLSVKTVSTYRTRILQKLDAASTVDIVRYAVSRKLVD